jgi:hypothetical protein
MDLQFQILINKMLYAEQEAIFLLFKD